MASETTTTTLDDLITFVIQEAELILSQGGDLADFVTVKPLPRGKGSAKFPTYGNVTAAAVDEATDLTNTAISTTSVTLTPTENGVMTTLTDMGDWESDPANVGADIGLLFADAIRDLRNQQIWALFDGFTNAVGGSDTDITEAIILAGIRFLVSAKAPKPYYLAITPYVMEDLLALYSTNNNITTAELRDMALNTGMLAPIYGVIPIIVDNLASGTSAGQADAADAKCGLFSKKALGMVRGYDIRIEPERDASLRATELVATSFYAVGEIQDTFGVEVLVDNKD